MTTSNAHIVWRSAEPMVTGGAVAARAGEETAVSAGMPMMNTREDMGVLPEPGDAIRLADDLGQLDAEFIADLDGLAPGDKPGVDIQIQGVA